jgi:arylsulfatase A-like enzyme
VAVIGALLVSLVGLAAALWLRAPPRSGAERPPNLLLVTIDTLRADRLASAEAGGAPHMPYLEALARKGVLFTRAYAPASWTAPSMASLVTGVYPARHGIERTLFLNGTVLAQEVLPEDLPLLPELLQAAGFATYGIAANTHLDAAWGFARGFDHYACPGFVEADVVLARLDAWIDEIRAREPWFVWLHFLDPHTPYTARDPWIDARWPGPRGPFRDLEGIAPAGGYARRHIAPGSQRLAYVEALYDSELSHVDAKLRGAIERLDSVDDTLVVVTSDHGEEFLEHGGFGHGHTLFEETIRVPLVMRLPAGARAGEVRDAPVSLVDLMPTLLSAAGVEPPPDLAGTDLLAPRLPRARTLYASLARGSRAFAVLEGTWKLVEERRPERRSHVYDLAADPGERGHDGSQPARTAALRRALAAHERSARAGRLVPNPRVPFAPEQAEALRALGYAD